MVDIMRTYIDVGKGTVDIFMELKDGMLYWFQNSPDTNTVGKLCIDSPHRFGNFKKINKSDVSDSEAAAAINAFDVFYTRTIETGEFSIAEYGSALRAAEDAFGPYLRHVRPAGRTESSELVYTDAVNA